MSNKYKNIKNRIFYLRKKLNLWSDYYYNKNQSLVEDSVYDFNLLKLSKLEHKYPFLRSQDSPTQAIGQDCNVKLLQIQHKSLMLSLDSISNNTELFKFNKKIQKILNTGEEITYCCELKIDGLAINLTYEYGILVRASTRGNGVFGEDVTKNALMMQTIPYNLKTNDTACKYIEIRGEVFINKSKFFKLNEVAKLNNKKLFSNPRNAASGSLRQINPKITENRYLMFYAYGIGYSDGYKLPDSQYKRLKILKLWNIPTNHYTKICVGLHQIVNYYNTIKKIRKTLDFEIDGIVIKVDSILHQNKIGCVAKAPKWAIAYKFPALEKITKIISVDFTIGRTGIVTPIAQIKPVCFLGTIVKFVSLYNFNEINRLNVMINDTVIVKHVGEVIPKISKVIFSKRTKNAKKIIFPKKCKICDSDIISIVGKKKWYCSGGITCHAQKKAALIHFASRNALNIRGMGKKIISKLVDKKILITPADFFRLDLKKITRINKIQLKSGKNLINSIKNSKEVKLHRLIYGLGIPQVGLTTSINLENYYKTYYNFINSDFHSLLKIKDIGQSTAVCIRKFLENKNNISFIQDLLQLNLKIK
ncbi:DNA ligase, NAD(+)-dependent [Wigglesworthia glossinidia endosymbiont of Glossina morsitans morsitans (Yale colony)]|uniref:DNA ligase n=1 Tax=Wigglesworthia glossinidia endosymbiont of Glossina morsitans morsitans (Yale colony) TaxID=1142511 RepID=H6Q5W5_WIGGL|nr:NAD-dependent DNA ligase LigA [Wigglesworthia glossinidia]AFA41161.1 DNA ligase, NAD(+)-dependent [Wigglesworthia glossinidia endosymbiont of Glossina morsitans morsitans (Yale colony)]